MKKLFPFLAIMAICYGATTSCNAEKFLMQSLFPKASEFIDIEDSTTYEDLVNATHLLIPVNRPVKRIILQGKDFHEPIIISSENWDHNRHQILNTTNKGKNKFVVVFQ